MPRRKANDGQELVFGDFNKITSALERELYDRVIYELLQRKTDGFFGDSFLVEYATSNSVTVRPGVGFQYDSSQAEHEPTKRLLYRATQTSHTIEPPDISKTRIDIVCVKATRVDTVTESRRKKDAISGTVTSENLAVQDDWQAEIMIVAGTPDDSPSEPATPSGYLKIASIEVSPVTGIAGAQAVTDKRTVFPIGGEILINSSGFSRLTAGSETPLKTLFSDIDAKLKNGDVEYLDIEDLEGDPDAPLKPDYHRLYFKEGVAYFRSSDGSITPLGSGAGGGGGGGGGAWHSPEGIGPMAGEENGEKVFYFYPDDANAKLVLFVKVPQGYLQGRPIKMYIGQYSPSSSNTQRLYAKTYLIRKNVDAIDSKSNFHTSNNLAITNTVANMYREVELDLTDSSGKINDQDVLPGSLLRVELYRDTSDTDTEAIRFIPSATEVKFS